VEGSRQADAPVVALKKAYDAFQNTVDSQGTYGEIALVRQFRQHANLIGLLGVNRGSNDRNIYFVFQLMDTDMGRAIRAKILLDVHDHFIFWEMLCALKYIPSGGVVHCGTKPADVLINAGASIKICDLELARGSGAAPDDMTEYVATRWYPAPELIFGTARYDHAANICAAGSILADLVSGRALFPGSSAMDQLMQIVANTGPPSQADSDAIESDTAASIPSQIAIPNWKVTLDEKLSGAPTNTLSLVTKRIPFHRAARITAEPALEPPSSHRSYAPSKDASQRGW
jgi:mitogen-activated protein kinase 15